MEANALVDAMFEGAVMVDAMMVDARMDARMMDGTMIDSAMKVEAANMGETMICALKPGAEVLALMISLTVDVRIFASAQQLLGLKQSLQMQKKMRMIAYEQR